MQCLFMQIFFFHLGRGCCGGNGDGGDSFRTDYKFTACVSGVETFYQLLMLMTISRFIILVIGT